MIIRENDKIKVVKKGTYGKTMSFYLVDEYPQKDDEFIAGGYEGAVISNFIYVNDEVAETTSGDPCDIYDFLEVEVTYYDVLDEKEINNYERVCVKRIIVD